MILAFLLNMMKDPWSIALLVLFGTVLYFLTSLQKPKKRPLTSFSCNDDIQDFASFRMNQLHKVPEHVDVIIVGAGIGGLSAGALLAKQGYQVLVLEQHDRFGGATHVFDLNIKDSDGEHVKCQFDSGYHYTCYEFCDPKTRTGQFLKYLNGNYCKWNDLGDPYDRVMFPGSPSVGSTEFHFVRTFPALTEKLISQVTTHPDTIKYLQERFAIWFDMVKEATSSTPSLFALQAFGIPKSIKQWPITEKIESLCRSNFEIYGPLSTAYVIKALFGCNYSKNDIISQKPLPYGIKAQIDGVFNLSPSLHTSDENLFDTLQKLQSILVHPIGDYAVQPKESSFVTHSYVLNYYENGSSYPSTSPQDMSLGMVREIFRHGGACVCGVKVNELVVTNSKVLGVRFGKKNTLIRADRVINAAGIWVLNNQLLPKDHPATKEFQEITSQPNACQPSMGHFYVFLCLKGSPQELNLDQTNLWCLNDLNKGAIDPCYTNFFEDPESNEVPATYITFPCAKESHWSERWQGISNCILFCDAPYEWFEDWKDSKHTSRPDDYIEFKNMLQNKLLDVFYEKCPQLKDKIIWVQSATPLSSEHYLNAFRGADYGSRVDVNYFSKESHKYLMTPETYFTNLFQAGQDAFTPSISGAMHGGILCALRMLTTMEKVEFMKNIIRVLYDEHQTDNPKDGIYKNGLRTIKSL